MEKLHLDFPRCIEETSGISTVLCDSRGNGQDIGIKNYIVRFKSKLINQYVVRTRTNIDLLLSIGGLLGRKVSESENKKIGELINVHIYVCTVKSLVPRFSYKTLRCLLKTKGVCIMEYAFLCKES